jgi:release factor glutamine methyltransferase
LADLAAAVGLTLGGRVTTGAARLGEAGCESPRLDAELLLAEVLGVGRERLVLDRTLELDAAAQARFSALLDRRAAREPVAYILGRREFRYLTLAVDRRVLIPRPETELLVELGLELPSGARVALALASERPDLSVVGLDIDADALAVARANGARLGLAVEFRVSDLLDDGPYDAVLANLPYVPEDAPLAPEITGYEPPRALFAGADGLDLVQRLIAQAAGVGLLALEIGPEQAQTVTGWLADSGFGSVKVLRDLAGLDRVVVGRS